MHWAAAVNDSPAVISALLAGGAAPNAQVRNGQTPLHWAAGNPNPTMVIAFLAAGARPSARTENGRTPLHWATYRNDNPAVVTALLDGGSEAKSKDKYGDTPWDLAQKNDALKGTDVYWRLNDARFD